MCFSDAAQVLLHAVLHAGAAARKGVRQHSLQRRNQQQSMHAPYVIHRSTCL
jgi:hypothetical protein